MSKRLSTLLNLATPLSYVLLLSYFLPNVLHNNKMDTLLILKHFHNLQALQENFQKLESTFECFFNFILDISNAVLTDPCTVCRLQVPISIIEWKAFSFNFGLNSFKNLMFTAGPSMQIRYSFSGSRCLITFFFFLIVFFLSFYKKPTIKTYN